jgi:hypothetical protein
MKLIIFFGLLSVILPAFGAVKYSNEMPASFVSDCEKNFPRSEVILNFHDIPVEEDQKESIRSLTISARKSKIHSGERYALGLTTLKLSWALDASVKLLRLNGPNVACARPQIIIELKVIDHKVHIAKELPRNSCEYNFVRDHEYKHVNINKDNMRRYSKELVAAFNKQFPSRIIYGSFEKVDSEVQKTMNKKWTSFIEKATAKMEIDGNKRHKALDSPEEYAKANTVCSGRISNIIEASEKK